VSLGVKILSVGRRGRGRGTRDLDGGNLDGFQKGRNVRRGGRRFRCRRERLGSLIIATTTTTTTDRREGAPRKAISNFSSSEDRHGK